MSEIESSNDEKRPGGKASEESRAKKTGNPQWQSFREGLEVFTPAFMTERDQPQHQERDKMFVVSLSIR